MRGILTVVDDACHTAKLGVPYEMGLKTINLTCAALMIWLLEFKTKLPEVLKGILPFSYFTVLPVRRHVASLCADGRGHAAGGHQLEKPVTRNRGAKCSA